MNSEIPFSYTQIAQRDLFIGREDLLNYLLTNIDTLESTIVYGQRRVGKSSLITEAIRQYQLKNKKHLFIQIDLSTCTSSNKFVSMICLEIERVIKKSKSLSERFQEIYNFISGIRPVAKINSITGEAEYGIDFSGDVKQIHKTIEDVFALLESVAKDTKLTLVLDEFQSIVDWNDTEQIQWLIRSKVQTHKNVGYIFSGSSKNLISKLFQESKGAFYKSSIIIHVDNQIDEKIFSKWIKLRFKKANFEINDETILLILNITNSHPYYTQKLCYTLWWVAKQSKTKLIDKQSIEKAIKTILEMEKTLYQERMDRFTKNQKKVIATIANMEASEKLLSQLTVEKYFLPTVSSIQKALQQLESENQPLIEKRSNIYLIEDPFFKIWLRESELN